MKKLLNFKKYIPNNLGSTLAIFLGFILISSWQENATYLLSGSMITSGAIAYKLAKKRAISKEKNYLSLFFEIVFSLIFLIIFAWAWLMTSLWNSAPLQFLIAPLWIASSFCYIKKKAK